MNTERAKRKLSAILSADVKGYSRLMGEDEVGTVRTLKEYRELMSRLIKEYRGRVVDSPGDNVLAEFASVVDALECSIEIQKTLKTKNAALPDNRRMEFRIGVNLGDVIEDEDRVYGDGVNIAARLEGLADGGGICISGTAFDQVKNKLSVGYQYLGKQTVKNIPDPIRAYKVLTEPEAAGKVIGEEEPKPRKWGWKSIASGMLLILLAGALVLWQFVLKPFPPSVEKADPRKMAFPLPDKPSIAVLPFANISDDLKQEVFSDGLTEEIITAISKSPNLFVIARTSAFTYKGKPVRIKQVSEDLGVRYVLEGSVRREGERIRITAQFIDAISGYHLWSERYDRDLKDIFALQEEIAAKIMKTLQVRLPSGDRGGPTGRGTKNVEAYVKVVEAAQLLFRYTKEDNAVARSLLEEAITLDPDYSRAYSLLSVCLVNDVVVLGTSKSPKQELERAIEMGQKSLTLDETDAHTNSIVAYLYAMTRQFDKAVAQADRALALDPNSFSVLNNSGFALTYAGKPEQAIPLVEKAIRLDPLASAAPYMVLNMAYLMVGRYEDALKPAKKAVERNPRFLPAQARLAIVCVLTGRDEDARAAVAEILKINPKFSVEEWAKTGLLKDQSYIGRFADALRKAGLPDKPALPLPDKPSIAVLPFVNMSGDPKQEFFADGLAEEIINGLTKVPQVFVIARNSSFAYKGKNVDVKQIGREMGVKYVLEGSVRREGDRVRITAQLVDATSGNHIFSERYDRDLKDIFALQDEITMKVLTAMRVKWAYGEHERAMAKGTKNLEAYLKVMEGWEYCQILNKENQAVARQLAEEAIALDRGYAQAYRLLAQAIAYEVTLGSYEHRDEALSRAMEMAQKAVLLDDTLAGAHATLGYIALLWKRDYGKAIAEAERAVALEPNSAEACFSLGSCLFWSGQFEEGIGYLKKALSFSPIEPARYLNLLAHSYAAIGQYEEAISLYKKIIQNHPNHRNAQVGLVCAYVFSGREEEARLQSKEILRIDPKFTVQGYMETTAVLYKDRAFAEKFRGEPLRKAGLK